MHNWYKYVYYFLYGGAGQLANICSRYSSTLSRSLGLRKVFFSKSSRN